VNARWRGCSTCIGSSREKIVGVMGGWPGQGAYANTEKELQRERASALMRIASQLESLLQRAGAQRAALAATTGLARQRAVGEHQRLCREACRWRWYLEVQREALGLTRHDALDALYPMPEAVKV
jgi:hypothetical protein